MWRKKYYFPKGMRPSKLGERREFYEREFLPENLENFFCEYPRIFCMTKALKKPVFAIDVGTDSKIIRREFSGFYKKIIYISSYKDFLELKQKLIIYLPEDVYYERNVVADYKKCRVCMQRWNCMKCKNLLGQELMLDIDPENISCSCKKSGIYSFCRRCLEMARLETIELYNVMKSEFDFKKIGIVYSGRGYHLHILDEDAFYLRADERRKITSVLLAMGFHIDEWVSNGSISLARMPGTLHALVSRIAKDISLEKIKRFNPLKDREVIPKFLIKNK